MRAKTVLKAQLTTNALSDAASVLYTVPPNTRAKLIYTVLSNNLVSDFVPAVPYIAGVVNGFGSDGSGGTITGGQSAVDASGTLNIVSVDLQIDSSSDANILNNTAIAAQDYIELSSNSSYFMLETGDIIRARSSIAGVSCVLTVEETSGTVNING